RESPAIRERAEHQVAHPRLDPVVRLDARGPSVDAPRARQAGERSEQLERTGGERIDDRARGRIGWRHRAQPAHVVGALAEDLVESGFAEPAMGKARLRAQEAEDRVARLAALEQLAHFVAQPVRVEPDEGERLAALDEAARVPQADREPALEERAHGALEEA